MLDKNLAYDRDNQAFLNAVLAEVKARLNLPDLPVLLTSFSRSGSFVWDMACTEPDFATA